MRRGTLSDVKAGIVKTRMVMRDTVGLERIARSAKRDAVRTIRIALVALSAATGLFSSRTAARADWRPSGIAPTTAPLATALPAASGARRRRETWTYVSGSTRLTVDVAVRDDDFRTSIVLAGETYTAGRFAGARWRADGNGIVHGVQADLQGDALDRAPQALFPIDAARCTLVGEVRLPARAWVVRTDPGGDTPAFLYIDEATHAVVREVARTGRTVVTTTFDRFETIGDGTRARHWIVDGGNPADRIDATLDDVASGEVSTSDVARPARRTFDPSTGPLATTDLPARFDHGRIVLTCRLEHGTTDFILDTGTASITVSPALANRVGGTALGHATLPSLTVGPLALDRVSVLTVDLGGGLGDGILGYDFFFGHVIEIDYTHERVRVLSRADAERAFADPATAVVATNVDQSLPLVAAGFGAARGDAFALDTGSPHLYVMRPFATRYAAEIAAHWTPSGHRPYVVRYLEGSIALEDYRVSQFELAGAFVREPIVGVQTSDAPSDDLALPFDGIVGTDLLQNFDLLVDYDGGRIGFRR